MTGIVRCAFASVGVRQDILLQLTKVDTETISSVGGAVL